MAEKLKSLQERLEQQAVKQLDLDIAKVDSVIRETLLPNDYLEVYLDYTHNGEKLKLAFNASKLLTGYLDARKAQLRPYYIQREVDAFLEKVKILSEQVEDLQNITAGF